MPALLGCTSRSSDFDSLPRGQRGSSAAIHRLGLQTNNQNNEFGSSTTLNNPIPNQNAVSFTSPTSPSKGIKSNKGRFRDRTKSTGSGVSLLDRNDSTNTSNGVRHSIDGSRPTLVKKSKSTSSHHSSVLGRRSSTLAQRAPPVSSDSYPIVSSDLDLQSSGAKGLENPFDTRQGNGHSSGNTNGGRESPMPKSISAPNSPQKGSQPRLNGQSPRVASPAIPSRKRVISKDMIGLPTNFQHTGHIGASSYRMAVGDSAALQAQLSEVAAALNFDFDLGSPPTVAPASPSPALSSLPKGVPESIMEDEGAAAAPRAEVQPSIQEEEETEEPLVRASSPAPPSIAPTLRPVSPSPSHVSTATASSRPLPNPPQANQSPSFNSDLKLDRSESPVRTPSARKPAPSTVGHSFNQVPSSLSSASSPKSPLSRQLSATSGVSGGGARKRKPVPRALELDPMIGSEDGSESINPVLSEHANFEDTALNDEKGIGAGLQRNVSVVGDLPGGFNKGGKRTALARANQLASAFSPEEPTPTEVSTRNVEDEEEDPTSKFNKGPNGTLRLAGKKMVEGPGGNYISDTANLRWNSAMKEITMALKDDDDQGGLEEGMRRADELLGKLQDQ